ncbi:MAG: hypothetical protein JKY23_00470 [Nitrospinaceae bacterium]|nr:hypothetical protein [Nitrospinaceae bacterium]
METGSSLDHARLASSNKWTYREKWALYKLYRSMCAHLTQRVRFRSLRQPHTCTADCHFYSARRLNRYLSICSASGTVHMCGPSRCQNILRMHDTQVCGLTSVQMKLEHAHALPVGNYITSHWPDHMALRGSRAYHRRLRQKRLGPWVVLGPRELEQQKRREAKGGGRVREVRARRSRLSVMSDLSDKRVTQSRLDKFRETTKAILLRTKFKPTSEQLEELVQMCEDMWRLVVQSKAYPFNSLAYSAVYHCLVVLYCASEGLCLTVATDDPGGEGVERFVILEQSQLLHDYMPLRNECAPPFESKQLTAMERRFLDCMSTCSAKSMHEYTDRVRGRAGPACTASAASSSDTQMQQST